MHKFVHFCAKSRPRGSGRVYTACNKNGNFSRFFWCFFKNFFKKFQKNEKNVSNEIHHVSCKSAFFLIKKILQKKWWYLKKKNFRKNRKKSQKNDKNPGSVIGLNFVKNANFSAFFWKKCLIFELFFAKFS